MTAFLIGLMVGATVGLLLGGMLNAAAHADAEADAYLRRIAHTCTDRCRPLMERHWDEYGRRVS